MERTNRKNQESKQRSQSNGGGSSKEVFTSECFIGGTIKSGSVSEDGGYVLVDVGKNSRFLMCDVYQSAPLADRLAKYNEGDHILIKGYVRGWSQKNSDGDYVNRVTIRITEIRSKDPDREVPAGYGNNGGSVATDDDIPF